MATILGDVQYTQVMGHLTIPAPYLRKKISAHHGPLLLLVACETNTCPFDTFLVGLKLRYLKPHSMMSVCFIVCCNINSSDRCCCKIPSDSWTGITKCATKYWNQSFSLEKPWPFWLGLWVSSENRESDWSSAEVVFFGSERYGFVWKLPGHLLLDNTCSSKEKRGKCPPILIVQFTLNRLPFW